MITIKNISTKKILTVTLMATLFAIMTLFLALSNTARAASPCGAGEGDTGKLCYKELIAQNVTVATVTAKITGGTANPTEATQNIDSPRDSINGACGYPDTISKLNPVIKSEYSKNVDDNGVKKNAIWAIHSDGKCYWHYFVITVEYDKARREGAGSAYSDAIMSLYCKSTSGTGGDLCNNQAAKSTKKCLNAYWDGHPSVSPPTVNDYTWVANCIKKEQGSGDVAAITTALKDKKSAADSAADSATSDATNTATDTGTDTAEEEKSTCNISGGLGWMVCPILDTISGAADNAYSILASNFLEVDSKLVDQKSPAFESWKNFRNIANVLFVIAFLLIIYSQITGGGDR